MMRSSPVMCWGWGENKMEYYKYCAGLFKTYQEYLESPQWYETKKYWVDYIKKCEACNESDKNKLTLHHLNYNNCGNEQREDIICLCNRCHTTYHLVKNVIDPMLIYLHNIRKNA